LVKSFPGKKKKEKTKKIGGSMTRRDFVAPGKNEVENKFPENIVVRLFETHERRQ
jgi:hypothetical protein